MAAENTKEAEAVLTENDVITAVERFLKKKGYDILEKSTTSQKGFDIKARNLKNGNILFVEAKGATSSKPSTKRYGKSFNTSQIESHVSRAILKLMKIISCRHYKSNVVMALPDNPGHRNLIEKISPALQELAIGILWVKDNLKVVSDVFAI